MQNLLSLFKAKDFSVAFGFLVLILLVSAVQVNYLVIGLSLVGMIFLVIVSKKSTEVIKDELFLENRKLKDG